LAAQGDGAGPDGAPPRSDLRDEPLDRGTDVGVLAEGDAGSPDELRMTTAVAVSGPQAAGERLQQGVRARVVPAGCDVEVLRSQQLGKRSRFERPDGADTFEARRR